MLSSCSFRFESDSSVEYSDTGEHDLGVPFDITKRINRLFHLAERIEIREKWIKIIRMALISKRIYQYKQMNCLAVGFETILNFRVHRYFGHWKTRFLWHLMVQNLVYANNISKYTVLSQELETKKLHRLEKYWRRLSQIQIRNENRIRAAEIHRNYIQIRTHLDNWKGKWQQRSARRETWAAFRVRLERTHLFKQLEFGRGTVTRRDQWLGMVCGMRRCEIVRAKRIGMWESVALKYLQADREANRERALASRDSRRAWIRLLQRAMLDQLYRGKLHARFEKMVRKAQIAHRQRELIAMKAKIDGIRERHARARLKSEFFGKWRSKLRVIESYRKITRRAFVSAVDTYAMSVQEHAALLIQKCYRSFRLRRMLLSRAFVTWRGRMIGVTRDIEIHPLCLKIRRGLIPWDFAVRRFVDVPDLSSLETLRAVIDFQRDQDVDRVTKELVSWFELKLPAVRVNVKELTNREIPKIDVDELEFVSGFDLERPVEDIVRNVASDELGGYEASNYLQRAALVRVPMDLQLDNPVRRAITPRFASDRGFPHGVTENTWLPGTSIEDLGLVIDKDIVGDSALVYFEGESHIDMLRNVAERETSELEIAPDLRLIEDHVLAKRVFELEQIMRERAEIRVRRTQTNDEIVIGIEHRLELKCIHPTLKCSFMPPLEVPKTDGAELLGMDEVVRMTDEVCDLRRLLDVSIDAISYFSVSEVPIPDPGVDFCIGFSAESVDVDVKPLINFCECDSLCYIKDDFLLPFTPVLDCTESLRRITQVEIPCHFDLSLESFASLFEMPNLEVLSRERALDSLEEMVAQYNMQTLDEELVVSSAVDVPLPVYSKCDVPKCKLSSYTNDLWRNPDFDMIRFEAPGVRIAPIPEIPLDCQAVEDFEPSLIMDCVSVNINSLANLRHLTVPEQQLPLYNDLELSCQHTVAIEALANLKYQKRIRVIRGAVDKVVDTVDGMLSSLFGQVRMEPVDLVTESEWIEEQTIITEAVGFSMNNIAQWLDDVLMIEGMMYELDLDSFDVAIPMPLAYYEKNDMVYLKPANDLDRIIDVKPPNELCLLSCKALHEWRRSAPDRAYLVERRIHEGELMDMQLIPSDVVIQRCLCEYRPLYDWTRSFVDSMDQIFVPVMEIAPVRTTINSLLLGTNFGASKMLRIVQQALPNVESRINSVLRMYLTNVLYSSLERDLASVCELQPNADAVCDSIIIEEAHQRVINQIGLMCTHMSDIVIQSECVASQLAIQEVPMKHDLFRAVRNLSIMTPISASQDFREEIPLNFDLNCAVVNHWTRISPASRVQHVKPIIDESVEKLVERLGFGIELETFDDVGIKTVPNTGCYSSRRNIYIGMVDLIHYTVPLSEFDVNLGSSVSPLLLAGETFASKRNLKVVQGAMKKVNAFLEHSMVINLGRDTSLDDAGCVNVMMTDTVIREDATESVLRTFSDNLDDLLHREISVNSELVTEASLADDDLRALACFNPVSMLAIASFGWKTFAKCVRLSALMATSVVDRLLQAELLNVMNLQYAKQTVYESRFVDEYRIDRYMQNSAVTDAKKSISQMMTGVLGKLLNVEQVSMSSTVDTETPTCEIVTRNVLVDPSLAQFYDRRRIIMEARMSDADHFINRKRYINVKMCDMDMSEAAHTFNRYARQETAMKDVLEYRVNEGSLLDDFLVSFPPQIPYIGEYGRYDGNLRHLYVEMAEELDCHCIDDLNLELLPVVRTNVEKLEIPHHGLRRAVQVGARVRKALDERIQLRLDMISKPSIDLCATDRYQHVCIREAVDRVQDQISSLFDELLENTILPETVIKDIKLDPIDVSIDVGCLARLACKEPVCYDEPEFNLELRDFEVPGITIPSFSQRTHSEEDERYIEIACKSLPEEIFELEWNIANPCVGNLQEYVWIPRFALYREDWSLEIPISETQLVEDATFRTLQAFSNTLAPFVGMRKSQQATHLVMERISDILCIKKVRNTIDIRSHGASFELERLIMNDSITKTVEFISNEMNNLIKKCAVNESQRLHEMLFYRDRSSVIHAVNHAIDQIRQKMILNRFTINNDFDLRYQSTDKSTDNIIQHEAVALAVTAIQNNVHDLLPQVVVTTQLDVIPSCDFTEKCESVIAISKRWKCEQSQRLRVLMPSFTVQVCVPFKEELPILDFKYETPLAWDARMTTIDISRLSTYRRRVLPTLSVGELDQVEIGKIDDIVRDCVSVDSLLNVLPMIGFNLVQRTVSYVMDKIKDNLQIEVVHSSLPDLLTHGSKEDDVVVRTACQQSMALVNREADALLQRVFETMSLFDRNMLIFDDRRLQLASSFQLASKLLPLDRKMLEKAVRRNMVRYFEINTDALVSDFGDSLNSFVVINVPRLVPIGFVYQHPPTVLEYPTFVNIDHLLDIAVIDMSETKSACAEHDADRVSVGVELDLKMLPFVPSLSTAPCEVPVVDVDGEFDVSVIDFDASSLVNLDIEPLRCLPTRIKPEVVHSSVKASLNTISRYMNMALTSAIFTNIKNEAINYAERKISHNVAENLDLCIRKSYNSKVECATTMFERVPASEYEVIVIASEFVAHQIVADLLPVDPPRIDIRMTGKKELPTSLIPNGVYDVGLLLLPEPDLMINITPSEQLPCIVHEIGELDYELEIENVGNLVSCRSLLCHYVREEAPEPSAPLQVSIECDYQQYFTELVGRSEITESLIRMQRKMLNPALLIGAVKYVERNLVVAFKSLLLSTALAETCERVSAVIDTKISEALSDVIRCACVTGVDNLEMFGRVVSEDGLYATSACESVAEELIHVISIEPGFVSQLSHLVCPLPISHIVAIKEQHVIDRNRAETESLGAMFVPVFELSFCENVERIRNMARVDLGVLHNSDIYMSSIELSLDTTDLLSQMTVGLVTCVSPVTRMTKCEFSEQRADVVVSSPDWNSVTSVTEQVRALLGFSETQVPVVSFTPEFSITAVSFVAESVACLRELEQTKCTLNLPDICVRREFDDCFDITVLVRPLPSVEFEMIAIPEVETNAEDVETDVDPEFSVTRVLEAKKGNHGVYRRELSEVFSLLRCPLDYIFFGSATNVSPLLNLRRTDLSFAVQLDTREWLEKLIPQCVNNEWNRVEIPCDEVYPEVDIDFMMPDISLLEVTGLMNYESSPSDLLSSDDLFDLALHCDDLVPLELEALECFEQGIRNTASVEIGVSELVDMRFDVKLPNFEVLGSRTAPKCCNCDDVEVDISLGLECDVSVRSLVCFEWRINTKLVHQARNCVVRFMTRELDNCLSITTERCVVSFIEDSLANIVTDTVSRMCDDVLQDVLCDCIDYSIIEPSLSLDYVEKEVSFLKNFERKERLKVPNEQFNLVIPFESQTLLSPRVLQPLSCFCVARNPSLSPGNDVFEPVISDFSVSIPSLRFSRCWRESKHDLRNVFDLELSVFVPAVKLDPIVYYTATNMSVYPCVSRATRIVRDFVDPLLDESIETSVSQSINQFDCRISRFNKIPIATDLVCQHTATLLDQVLRRAIGEDAAHRLRSAINADEWMQNLLKQTTTALSQAIASARFRTVGSFDVTRFYTYHHRLRRIDSLLVPSDL